MYSEKDFDFDFNKSLSDYYIYTDKYQKVYNINPMIILVKSFVQVFNFGFVTQLHSTLFQILTNDYIIKQIL